MAKASKFLSVKKYLIQILISAVFITAFTTPSNAQFKFKSINFRIAYLDHNGVFLDVPNWDSSLDLGTITFDTTNTTMTVFFKDSKRSDVFTNLKFLERITWKANAIGQRWKAKDSKKTDCYIRLVKMNLANQSAESYSVYIDYSNLVMQFKVIPL